MFTGRLMSRKKVSIYTNMPTPNQLDFFDSLSEIAMLKVVYFSSREGNRQWTLPVNSEKYQTKLLVDNWLAKQIQKKIPSFHFSNRIMGIAFREQSDCVILNGSYWIPNVILALFILTLRGKKTYFYGEAIFPVVNKVSFIMKKILLFPVSRFTNGILAVGNKAIDCYKQYGYKKPIVNIPYNIDLGPFSYDRIDTEKISRLKIQYAPSGEFIYLTSGALISRKGIDTIIKAFQKLNKPDSTLLILGDGEERQNLMNLANGNSNIHFAGFIEKEDIPNYFLLADTFVFGSRYDGWALVINEAIASGLPIICSNKVGAAAELLVNNQSGLICNPEDVEEFAEAMRRIADDEQLRKTLQHNVSALRREISSTYNASKVYAVLGMD